MAGFSSLSHQQAESKFYIRKIPKFDVMAALDPGQHSYCRCCCHDPDADTCRGEAIFGEARSKMLKAVYF